ncbi:copper-transporting ATPase PAA1, chloroplastic-like [Phragmites australis]|uniref:copper-transporting ATPase PAA1, chloroplastic-like n=1 Tax=Phragmites australis TaxID=29695 RepID=UPI002D7A304D|nr:copper-transporting ATPase PAA1, chloroplastic-like [Phragmites australis]
MNCCQAFFVYRFARVILLLQHSVRSFEVRKGKRLPLPVRGFASISVPSSFGGGGGGGGGGDDSGAGAAAAALGEAEPADGDPDAIVLHVEGMCCGGCAAKVKRMLESQPEVTAAMVHFEKAIALVRTTPEAKAMEDWQKPLGEKLANHLRIPFSSAR